ncbi:uncharacterized protein F4812DRAFT_471494 [Daldinia caldariorum]|uniref:uncharacterized protein n=1 Tax=Daldinia caldariorum TaxID=326644 RepID=UPI002008BA1F|nr:uncharacterized protein F4812DRAFT_471494 [Daldinia caldariorum]KAI1467428.1 hypothetical protein F4812DRAFT_471494 [Daldinia caldariorum]
MPEVPVSAADTSINANGAHDNASPTSAAPEPDNTQPDGPGPSSDGAEPAPETPLESNIQPSNPPPEVADPETPEPPPAPAPTSEAFEGPPSPPPNAEPATPQSKDPELALDQPLPLTYWLLAGGTGPPPTTGKFLRMTSERNAVSLEAEARAAARKQAREERKAYLAAWDKEWGPGGVRGLLARAFGSKKSKARIPT